MTTSREAVILNWPLCGVVDDDTWTSGRPLTNTCSGQWQRLVPALQVPPGL